jgi:hypothetical protein
MIKEFKYQWLVNELRINHMCPFHTCKEDVILAFRWADNSNDYEDNFLPRILIDRKRNVPSRQNDSSEESLCSRCGLSMFNSFEHAKKNYSGLPDRTKNLLGYTHIVSGQIDSNDGIVTIPNKHGHFDIFEYKNTSLIEKFSIVEEI